jgi:hypothetical protein
MFLTRIPAVRATSLMYVIGWQTEVGEKEQQTICNLLEVIPVRETD